MHFDVIILGSGPGGYVASIRSAQLGMKTAIVEKNELGGISLNWGCIPTKSILNSAKLLQDIKKNIKLFGINNNFDIYIDKIFIKSRNTVNTIKKRIYYLLKKNGVNVIYGEGKLKKGKKIEVLYKNKIKIFSASNIIIATGATPKIDKELYDGKSIITYKEALSLSFIPKTMIIIGTDSIGLEFSYFYNCMGSKIILIEASSLVLPNEDEDISIYIKSYIEKTGVLVYTSSVIDKVFKKNKKVFVQFYIKNNPDKKITLESDILLYSIGVSPNIKNIGLKKIGINVNNGYIVVDKNYKTNINGFYAIGDVINTISLSHVAFHEGINCIENIKGLNCQNIDYNNIPKCIYSFPEIASVGITEKEAIKKGFKLKISKFPLSFLDRSICDDYTDGFIKLIFDEKYDEWLGCHMIGNKVSDLISEVVIARKLETTSEEILNSVHPYPSLSESILEAIFLYCGKSIHYINKKS